MQQRADNARLVIPSEEDRSPMSESWWARAACRQIYVTRDSLNNVASRLQPMIDRAACGETDSWLRFYSQFPDHWRALGDVQEGHGHIRLHYVRWLTDTIYRKDLADRIGMEREHVPGYHSVKGGGSSFSASGEHADAAAGSSYLNRYRSFPWSRVMIDCIFDWDDRNNVLSGEERKVLRLPEEGARVSMPLSNYRRILHNFIADILLRNSSEKPAVWD